MIAALLPVALSLASAHPQDLSKVASIATMQGECRKLILPGGGDQTSRCGGKILNIAYRDNRSSFRVAVNDVLMVGFYGDDQAAVGDSATLVVRKVIVTRPDGKIDALDAPGECRYTNPYAGPSHVDCKAKGKTGEVFELSFVSDGKPPSVQRF